MVEAKRQYLAVASAGISLAPFVWLLTLHLRRVGVLRGLWWRLCLHGVDVAARCGWRETDFFMTGRALIALCGMLIIVAGQGRTGT